MHIQAVTLSGLILISGLFTLPVCAEETPPAKSQSSASAVPLEPQEPHLQSIPLPTDPELEKQIQEVQNALTTIHQQMVRRREVLQVAQDPAAKAKLYEELEQLRKDREDLESLLHKLVEEAKMSQRTAIDEALARARSLERQQEAHQQREEIIRERRQQ